MSSYVWIVTYSEKLGNTGESRIDDVFSSEKSAQEYIEKVKNKFPSLDFEYEKYSVND